MKSIRRHTVILLFILILLAPGFSFAEQKTFVREYSCPAIHETGKNTARTIALRKVKNLLLESLVTYLANATEAQNFRLNKDQMVTLAAVIVPTDIVEEQWDGRTYMVKSKITVDAGIALKSMNDLCQDRQKINELADVRKRSDELLKENKRLRQTLATGKKKRQDSVAYHQTIKELNAVESFETGYQLLIAKRRKEALRALTMSVELDPQFAEAYNTRGLAYEELGDIRRAIQDYHKTFQLNPKSAIACNNLGIAYGKMGNHRQAIAGYDKAIALDPLYANAYGNRGNAYRKLGKFEQAVSDFNKVIELNPQLALAYFLRGGIYAALGDNNRACADFKTASGLGHNKAQHYLVKPEIHCPQGSAAAGKTDAAAAKPAQTAESPTLINSKPPLKPENKTSPDVFQKIVIKTVTAPSLSHHVTPIKTKSHMISSTLVDPRYQSIKAIVLYNGKVIEGQIMSLNAETVRIHTSERGILSYSFEKDVKTFIKK
jgi:tetratricopeptide (TPR) repeat protein